ncbi:MAG: urate hydroxylase PuuD [Betaproteobacteria bacterium]|nr:urate hydroxylase PuuD [Betaproteobacteria bacterium]MDE2124760.1 urate hydroxylase PuuD [Betaproteobacteria bacterium]MDE2187464.1 urate hydroxylase PuuD [Betaproteobacteria bacterium]MDE2325326.1 urate hydroxylase PuuD [Betaproteobacteria bacterium]
MMNDLLATLLPYAMNWADLLLRWLHVIAAIAWIGSSFYFVWLDNSLEPPKAPDLKAKGVDGELWAVHGGGFYNPQKYLVAPQDLPQHLHWFYWESYTTWLSGFALLSVLYLYHAGIFIVDPQVYAWPSPALAGLALLGFLVVGWLVYDGICRLFGQGANGDRTVGAMVALYVVIAAWAACHLFAGRAAFLITGAMLATMMSANVLFWIIPGQRRVVAAMRAGQTPDPMDGKRGKQRSVHNTYFTLPVVFAMLSNHYSFVYDAKNNWIVLVLMMLAGALIRQFFVLKHKGAWKWHYWGVAVVIILAVAIALAPKPQPVLAAAKPVSFAMVQHIVQQRCILCHAGAGAQKGVRLDSAQGIVSHAQDIYQQVVVTRAMPLNNATQISELERAQIGQWVKAGAKP